MKKLLCLFAALLLALSLAACGKKPVVTPDVTPTPTPTATPTPTPAADLTAEQELALTALLQRIDAEVAPGSAGSTLKATAVAAALLDWDAETAAPLKAVRPLIAAYWKALSAEAKTAYTEKTAALYAALPDLLGDKAAELLEDAGYTALFAPWDSQRANDLLTALVEATGGSTGEK